MTTALLLALDLVAAIITAGAWIAAAVLAAPPIRRRGAWLVIALVGVGLLGLLAQLLCTALLAADGWWFVQEKVVFALPVAVAAAIAVIVIAGPTLLGVARGTRPAPGARGRAALVGAAAAG
uniref:hypothetical protein n=1 Tax=Cryobacterium sp. N22 TaxID=2048290 RepID=UPI0035134734